MVLVELEVGSIVGGGIISLSFGRPCRCLVVAEDVFKEFPLVAIAADDNDSSSLLMVNLQNPSIGYEADAAPVSPKSSFSSAPVRLGPETISSLSSYSSGSGRWN